MKQKNIREIILAVLGIALILGGITYAIRQSSTTPIETVKVDIRDERSAQITLSIDGLYSQKSISIEKDETILQILEKLNYSDSQLQLKFKSYGDLGVLIEAMGGQTNGADGNYWQYTVNGVAPMVGAGKYNLKNSDTVEWQFKPSEF